MHKLQKSLTMAVCPCKCRQVVKSLSLAATVVPSAALPGSYLLSLDTANLVRGACGRVSTQFPNLFVDVTFGLTLQTRTLALNVLSVHAFSRSWIMQKSSYAKPNGDLAVASGSRMLMNLQRTTNQTTAIARSSVVIGKQPADVGGWVDVDASVDRCHTQVPDNILGCPFYPPMFTCISSYVLLPIGTNIAGPEHPVRAPPGSGKCPRIHRAAHAGPPLVDRVQLNKFPCHSLTACLPNCRS